MPTWTPPITLQPGTVENVNDVNTNFTNLSSALNALDETNVPNLAAAFTSYKRLSEGHSQVVGGAAAATYMLPVRSYQTGNNNAPVPGAAGVSQAVDFVMYLDPAIYAANARTTKLALRLVVITNAVAPASNFTAGMYPVATWGGAASAGATVATLGAVVTGSTAAVNAPAAGGPATTISADFNFPTAGYYVFGVVTSAVIAATSVAQLLTQLEVRQV